MQSIIPSPEGPSGFAEWYGMHGIPLGIGRENARVIYLAALDANNADVLANWRADYNAILEQRDAWKAAFDEVEGQRNNLVKECENLRSAITEHLVAKQEQQFASDCGVFCDCGHPRGRHMGDGQCLMFGCDCMAMRQWVPR